MAITINGKLSTPPAPIKKKKRTHVMPLQPPSSLYKDGRWRIKHILWVLDISHNAFNDRRRYKSHYQFPQPDGYDPLPYWHASTVIPYFDGPHGKNKKQKKGKVIQMSSNC